MPELDQTVSEAPAATYVAADEAYRLRRIVRWLTVSTVVALTAAVLLNWFVLRGRSEQFAVRPVERPVTTYQPNLDFDEDESAIKMLPSTIIAFETIAHHPVPGRGNQAAEALYVTLNMNLEIQRPIALYARAEGFASTAEAEAELKKRMAPYTVRPENRKIGAKIATTAYSADEGTWAVGWIEGPYYTFIKAEFKDKIPAQKRDFLRTLGVPLAEGVEKFQRTGEQGLQF